MVAEKAQAVAREVALYLKTHPGLVIEDFPKDPPFMKVAVQMVGKTGNTEINSAPTIREPWIIRAHPRENLIGVDILGGAKQRMSHENFIRFRDMHDRALKNQSLTTGYYRFLDDREKFNAMVPVAGTNRWILATTYIDEFTIRMQDLQKRAQDLTHTTLKIVLAILMIAILLADLVVFVYSTRLASHIKTLTGIANRIRLGDPAEAVTRLQSSIRIAIERLKRKN